MSEGAGSAPGAQSPVVVASPVRLRLEKRRAQCSSHPAQRATRRRARRHSQFGMPDGHRRGAFTAGRGRARGGSDGRCSPPTELIRLHPRRHRQSARQRDPRLRLLRRDPRSRGHPLPALRAGGRARPRHARRHAPGRRHGRQAADPAQPHRCRALRARALDRRPARRRGERRLHLGPRHARHEGDGHHGAHHLPAATTATSCRCAATSPSSPSPTRRRAASTAPSSSRPSIRR